MSGTADLRRILISRGPFSLSAFDNPHVELILLTSSDKVAVFFVHLGQLFVVLRVLC